MRFHVYPHLSGHSKKMSYRNYGKLDDPVRTEGDVAFRGLNTFMEAESLEPGFVQKAENIRMDGDSASVRLGWDFLAATASGPLNAFSYSASDDEVFTSGKYSDPDDNNLDWLVLVTKTKVILWNEDTPNGLTVNYVSGQTVTTAQTPTVVQAFSKVYIMRLGQRPLEWDGDITATGTVVDSEFGMLSASSPGAGLDAFPSTDYALYTCNRLVGFQPPTVATSTTSKTGAQIIVASELLGTGIKSSESEFYLNLGSADWAVAAISYIESQLIVFLRHSVHCLTNLHATSISAHYEITREYGCIARRSIAQSGAQTYFLSDAGVMIMTPQSDPGKGMGIVVSKVQGEAVPLSRPIQNKILDVNEDYAHLSAGIVHDGRYYLSYASGTESDTTPRNVAVYDILLGAWVSIDRYPDGIYGWVTMPYGSNPMRSRLFATMPKGFYLMEENLGLDDSGREIGDNSQSGTTAIAGALKTRNYSLGNLSVKRWNRGQLGVNVVASDAIAVAVNTVDPDTSTDVLSYKASGTEEALLRFGAHARGFSANVEITTSAGSPSFRHVSIDGTENALGARLEVA